MGEIFTRVSRTQPVFSNFGGIITHVASRLMRLPDARGINFVKDLGGNPTQFLKNIYVDTGGDKTQANFLPPWSW
jgi:hypothetical protein